MAKKSTLQDEKVIREYISNAIYPWKHKKLRRMKYGYYFTTEIVNSIDSKTSPSKNFDTHLISSLNPTGASIEVDLLNELTKNSNPVLIAIWHDSKLKYLLLDETFINALFSKNPSWPAQNAVDVPYKTFSNLTKTKIKEIREFVHNWKRVSYSFLKSGIYFDIKDKLNDILARSIREITSLKTGISLETLSEISESVNRAIYTVAIVGPTKAGKSTIINSLVSKYVSPIDIRPTTGIPTNIVPGKEEKSEILFKDGKVIVGPADESFLNEYVAIDKNRSNVKDVKMVTVWVKSTQMEKGLAFCDFPGLDDPDPEIEKTVSNALKFVDAIIYVIDASGMETGFKFPKYYRDDLLNLKEKDRIFLVINKIDSFNNAQTLREFKGFIDEQLDLLEIKSFLPYPPIFMDAKKAFERRLNGDKKSTEMDKLESQIWDHLLENKKSGMHNLMNIIGEVAVECDRLSRIFQTRMLDGNKKQQLQQNLNIIKKELSDIKMFEKEQRAEIQNNLRERLQAEKEYLLQYYRNYLRDLNSNQNLPTNIQTRDYVINQFTQTAPLLFDMLENDITNLLNQLNSWIGEKLELVEIPIDNHTKIQFKNSETFHQLLQPISNIFSESYGKSVPTGMVANIFYHVFNFVEKGVNAFVKFFTNRNTVRKLSVIGIMRKLGKCYDEIFEKTYFTFKAHLDHRCDELLGKVVDRTNFYLNQLNKQISQLNKPLTEAETKLHNIAIDKLVELDNDCAGIKLQIDEYSKSFHPKLNEEIEDPDHEIEKIEIALRILINTTLVNGLGINEAKTIIPTHLHSKIEDRLRKFLRDHPKTKKEKYRTLESQLPFCDLMELQDIIVNKLHWSFFEITFNNIENFKKHLLQLSTFRNSIRHSREITKLIRAEGTASIVWFNMALKTD